VKQRIARFAGKVAKFSAGQSALQLLQALSGLALVWLLAVDEFALYAVFTGTLGFSSVLLGFGLASSVVSLVGENASDRAIVGRYLFAALRLRMWFLGPAGILGVGFLVYSGFRMECGPFVLAAMCVNLLLCNFFTAQIDLFGTPLQMLGRLGTLYKWGVAAELAKLSFMVALWSRDALGALNASCVIAIVLGLNAAGLRHASGRNFLRPSDPPLKEQSQLWRIVSPLLPNVLFSSFQGQITILVAGLVGNTAQIASVGALGRLARIMAFLEAANAMLIGPALAKQRADRLWRTLPIVIGAAASLSAIIALAGFMFPSWFVLVLGANYRNLVDAVWIVTLGVALGYLASVLTTVAFFRHWVAWWSSITSIALVVAAQIGVAAIVDLRTVAGVLFLGVAAGAARALTGLIVVGVARWRPSLLRNPKRADS
jgi:O-antigen/teichoic acid export membrane protein